MKDYAASEIWDQSDNWRGITDPKERRRRQNRVHQRAHRKKRRAFPTATNDENQEPVPQTAVACHLAVLTKQGPLPVFHSLPDFLAFINCVLLSQQVRIFLDRAYQDWSLSRPVPKDLPTLSRLNAFDALMRNAQILQIPVEALGSDDDDSPLLLTSRHSTGSQQLSGQFPDHLRPTELQKSVRHHPWLDLFPFPSLRDRILQGLQAGELDEDTVCDELCCDLLNLESKTEPPVLIWGDSWQASQWEFSISFIDRWAVLLEDCQEILAATNHWRRLRGAEAFSLPPNQPGK
ncbi:unnamed protein product [Clonostachys rhizophaga]|uniref:BZIP domain-containing protein n=1 Tax=Clonostachys rhizophaga TaxID=160324 RepID=A0A9N9V236_9HYPO|nr:unnamed protein product [Clonostachys rhizophaga]